MISEKKTTKKTMANKDKSTNQRVNEERSEKLRRARLEVMVSGTEIRVAELIGFLIDNYLDEAVKDIKSKR